ncbi:ABC transporter permease [Elioraea sp.]|jgi:tungstate transport system permease protein|uniref:ABC transporter permease n=1 Tax=Elioraea sp. TaxID=2185103 RepID=UPI0021DCEFA7|nr:ABC transporter permease [Elioraea sp.]GIX09171.1 MAG: ABC transporter permease [Elioraea sp.]
MEERTGAVALALSLLLSADEELVGIVWLSLRVSLGAAAVGFALGVPVGAALAMRRFPGHGAVLLAANALLGLPPVVAGLAVYLLLSRSGPLGPLGLLFTPTAMVIAQSVLTTPIAAALAHRALTPVLAEIGEALAVDGAGPVRTAWVAGGAAAAALVTVFLAAFGRAIAEVGAILTVGGNIRGHTRTMTTTIALETQKGDLPLALALGLILLLVVVAVNAAALRLAPRP